MQASIPVLDKTAVSAFNNICRICSRRERERERERERDEEEGQL